MCGATKSPMAEEIFICLVQQLEAPTFFPRDKSGFAVCFINRSKIWQPEPVKLQGFLHAFSKRTHQFA